MKNKKLLYLLIPATVLIWAAIAYNIISGLKQKDNFSDIQYLPDLNAKTDTLRETYTLLADYSDPFRVGRRSAPAVQKKIEVKPDRQSNRNQRPDRQNQPRVYWPMVVYNGLIINEQKQVALLQIDSKKFLMTEGEERSRVKLLRMFSDSVMLEFGGEKKTLTKN